MFKSHKTIISILLLVSFLLPYVAYAFFPGFDKLIQAATAIKSGSDLVKGFTGVGIPGVSGSSGSKVPILDEATIALQQKEVGTKKITVPGTQGFLGISVSWDKLAWGLANMAIHKITKDIVGWIQTGGRNGKPLFITNWEDFLKGVANEASGIFIDELKLTEICRPFKPRLQLLLESGSGGTYRQRAQCTIQDVTRNVENFYKDFKQGGGWERWFEITMVPQNNFYGAYYMALEEKLLRESLTVEAKKSEALAGGGFLGEETCVRLDPITEKCTKFSILTPGKTIERQLNDVLAPPSGEKRLEVADEIDEIISAAFTRLLTSIRGKSKNNKEKLGIVSPEPLKEFVDDTKKEVPGAAEQVLGTIELPQAIALSEQTSRIKEDSISKIRNQLIGTIESLNTCRSITSESQIKEQKDRIEQLEKDVGNLNIITAQLRVGQEQLENSKTTDEVYESFTDLKAAVDTVISLYNSSIDENNQIVAEIESAQSELEQCQKTTNE